MVDAGRGEDSQGHIRIAVVDPPLPGMHQLWERARKHAALLTSSVQIEQIIQARLPDVFVAELSLKNITEKCSRSFHFSTQMIRVTFVYNTARALFGTAYVEIKVLYLG
jgi:hypothetical protein